MKKIFPLLIVITCLSLSACTQDIKSGRLMFYNTEDFFDTIKDPKTDDGEFTPAGTAKWTSERYQHKLANISKVLGAMSEADPPIAIGLSEMENKHVSEDLAAQPVLRKYDLGVIEQDSPDPRGIDVALLYSKKFFVVTGTEFLKVKLPDTDRGTRDILYVSGTVRGIAFHIFVNHWPSRREGTQKSAPLRCAAATVLRNRIAQIIASDRDAHIIIMGDFNDNPIDSAVAQVLGAIEPQPTLLRDKLYDLMAKPFKEGQFSYFYRGEKEILDQMIVSENLIDKASATHVKDYTGHIFKEQWMLYHNQKYGDIPNRTYSGPIYHGGFSDHLPVYIDLVLQ